MPMRRISVATCRRPIATPSAFRRSRSIRLPAKGKSRLQLVHPAHDREVGRGHGSRPVVDAAPADVQGLRLAGDGQPVRPVDHRLALGRPALLSAPAKKSFVSVSSPILAWSVLTSTGGVPASARGPKTPAA